MFIKEYYIFRCIASSKVGSADHSARINVYGLPFVRSMEKHAIVAGGTLIVHCPFAGHPVEAVVWERGKTFPFIINCSDKINTARLSNFKISL